MNTVQTVAQLVLMGVAGVFADATGMRLRFVAAGGITLLAALSGAWTIQDPASSPTTGPRTETTETTETAKA